MVSEALYRMLELCQSKNFSGNFFGKLTTEAVKADENSSGIIVSGNMMTELNQGAQNGNKAIDLGGAKDVLVKDNLIRK